MTGKIKSFDKSNVRGGFTLIEMLIVVAVIAILAGVVLTGVSGFQASARDTRRIGDLRNVQNYLELFFNKCGHYPVSGSSETSCGTPGSAAIYPSWDDLVDALSSVTSQIPSDLVASRPYVYAYGDDGLSYVLRAEFERDNGALRQDIDGTPLNVACDENATNFYYCIQS